MVSNVRWRGFELDCDLRLLLDVEMCVSAFRVRNLMQAKAVTLQPLSVAHLKIVGLLACPSLQRSN